MSVAPPEATGQHLTRHETDDEERRQVIMIVDKTLLLVMWTFGMACLAFGVGVAALAVALN